MNCCGVINEARIARRDYYDRYDDRYYRYDDRYYRYDDRDRGVRRTLERNLGRVCTVYTRAGGRAGDGFTGVVAQVDDDVCRIVSYYDDYEYEYGCRHRCRHHHDRRYDCENIKTIPIDDIVCVSAPLR